MTPSTVIHKDYRPEIDGLRAIAVMAVILFHAGFTELSGGFVGVDIFFVISGYLITRILLNELQENKFSLVRFYERRIRRILPVLYFVLAVSSIAAWLWLLPIEYQRFGKSLLAVIFFVPNFLFWREGDYFDVQSEFKPLLHTWSLAVEEQYYLIFPILLLVLWRFQRNRTVIYLLILTLLSFFLAEIASYWKPKAAFFLAPTRAWELMVGTLAAFCSINSVVSNRNEACRSILAFIGLNLIIYSIFFFDKSTRFPGAWAVLPVIGTLLIILYASSSNVVGRILANRLFVGVGLLSYSAYLWHQPILVFFRQRMLTDPTKVDGLFLVVLTFLLSYLSWRFIENPFRDRNLVRTKTVYVTMGLASVLLVGSGIFAFFNNGVHARLSNYIDGTADRNKLPLVTDGWCFYSVDTIQSLRVGEAGRACFLGGKDGEKKALLFGDSFAGQYEPFWDEVGKAANLTIHAVTTNWCYPSLTSEFTGPQTSRAYAQCLDNRKFLLENMHQYDVLILSGYWRQILQQEKMSGPLELIEHAASRVPLVVLMGSPVVFDDNVNVRQQLADFYEIAYDVGDASREGDRLAVEADKMLRDSSRKASNVIEIRRQDLFGVDRAAFLSSDGIPYSWDGYHISTYGSRLASMNFLRSDSFSSFQMHLKNQ